MVANANGGHCGAVVRYASSSSCYRARVNYGSGNLEVARNGTQVGSYGIVSTEGFIATSWKIRLRVTVSGSDALVQARYWASTNSEPGTWQVEYTDTSPLSAGSAATARCHEPSQPCCWVR